MIERLREVLGPGRPRSSRPVARPAMIADGSRYIRHVDENLTTRWPFPDFGGNASGPRAVNGEKHTPNYF